MSIIRVPEETNRQGLLQWQNLSRRNRTKTAQKSVKKRFAQDLKILCRTEYENAYQHYGDDIPKLIRAMSYSADSIVRCYSERLCRLHSLACRGLTKNRWSSLVLPKYFTVNLTESDETFP